MGYMQHHALMVSSWSDEKIAQAYAQARVVLGEGFGELLSPIIESTMNGYRTFFVAPDGSKEGWDTSDEGDALRDRIIRAIDALAYKDGSNSVRYAEVMFADDQGKAAVTRHN